MVLFLLAGLLVCPWVRHLDVRLREQPTVGCLVLPVMDGGYLVRLRVRLRGRHLSQRVTQQ
jgi:hypothetical protein